MLFCPKNKDDISRYYRGTYIKLKEFGDQLFFLENCNAQSVFGVHESGEKFTIYLDDSTPYEVDYILPHKSFFQHGPNAMMLERMPAKQYFRGLCDANTQLRLIDINGKIVTKRVDMESLKTFVNKPAFLNLFGVLDDAQYHTVALSPRMMYRRTNRNLYVDFHVVGKVYPTSKKIVVTNELFMDEVKAIAGGAPSIWTIGAYVPPPAKQKTTTEDLLREMSKKTYVENLGDIL